jgi:hypothetical protein
VGYEAAPRVSYDWMYHFYFPRFEHTSFFNEVSDVGHRLDDPADEHILPTDEGFGLLASSDFDPDDFDFENFDLN